MLRTRRGLDAGYGVLMLLVIGCEDGPAGPDGQARAGPDDGYVTADEEYWQVLEASPTGAALEFADLEVFFEYNATDNDLGMQLFLDAQGWRRVRGIDPNGVQIVEFTATGELAELGLTEIFFETAEPSPAEVLALLPEGEYRFVGRTVSGEVLRGTSVLSHQLPPAAQITAPTEGQVIHKDSLVVRWQPVSGLESIQLIVENERNGATLQVDLRPTATQLPIPREFLRPGMEHKVEILTIARNGNKTITEVSFETAP